MRFTIRTLLGITFAVSAFLAAAQAAGFWVVLGVVLTLCPLFWAIRSPRRGLAIALRLMVAVSCVVGLWFLVVDWSWFIDECEDCKSSWDIAYYRVLGSPLITDIDEGRSPFDAALADLGLPCQHPNVSRWHKHRWWGGLICKSPCWNGIHGVAFEIDEYYSAAISERIREIGQTRPAFAREMRRRVIDVHDYRYFWEALMVDQMALDYLESPSTSEARVWLQGSSTGDQRTFDYLTIAQSVALVEDIYAAGAKSVVTVKPPWYTNDEDFPRDRLYVELPSNPEDRLRLFRWSAKHSKEQGDSPDRDFGQDYLRINL